MNDSPIADKVLERIAQEHLTPRPRWQFTVTNIAYWVLWAACTLAGAVAVAALVFGLANAGWEFREVTHRDLFAFLLEAIPSMWIALLAVVLFAAFENMRHTETGYRYPMLTVLGLSVLGSVAIGVALYAAGIGQQVEEGIGGRIPLARPMLIRQRTMWTDPSKGMLAGEVVSVVDDADDAKDVLTLRTFDGKQWTVLLQDVSSSGRNVLARSPLVRVVGLPVMATSTDQPFRACFLFPWVLHGGPRGGRLPHGTPPSDMRYVRASAGAPDAVVNCEGMPKEEFVRLRAIERLLMP